MKSMKIIDFYFVHCTKSLKTLYKPENFVDCKKELPISPNIMFQNISCYFTKIFTMFSFPLMYRVLIFYVDFI